MQAVFMAFISTLGSILGSWITKLMGKDFLEWAMLWTARKYVESTETKADDEWFAKIEATIKEGK